MSHDEPAAAGQQPAHGDAAAATRDLGKLKNLALVVYILQAASLMFGFTLIIAVILNYVKLIAVQGTWLASHFQWQINTFWWFLLWFMVGALTAPFGVGYAIVFGAVVWLIFRFVKGWMALNANAPVTVKPTGHR